MKKITFVLLFAITFIFGKAEAATQVATNTADSLALVALYNETNGPHWRDNTNWLQPGTTVNNWKWVTVDPATGRVVGLSLANNRLRCSSFPSSVCDLTALTSIDLSENDIPGEIPAAFWTNLKKLKSIYLNNNKLFGTIPETIWNMTGLTNLVIHTNAFSGQLPNALWTLSALEKIEIFSNEFEGLLPESIGNLKALTSFRFGGSVKKFSGQIPDNLWTLTNLINLELIGTNFQGQISSQIKNLKQLKVLTISGDTLMNGFLPNELFDLTDLEELSLNSCRFSGQVSPNIKNLKKLTRLNLSSNRLVSGENGFSGEILSYLIGLTNLTELDLSINNFAGSIPNNFGNLKLLKTLNLGINKFSGTIPSSFWNLNALTSLKMNENSFFGPIPTDIGNLTDLEVLYLNQNEFSGTFPASVAKLSKLKQLYFNDNLFDELPVLNFSPTMERVDCYRNNFTFEDFERNIQLVNNANFNFKPQNDFGIEDTLMGTVNFPITMTITCGGDSNSYTWLQNGTTPRFRPIVNSYYIKNLILSDSGAYTVRVTNSNVPDLTLVSRPIHLKVEENCIIADLTGLDDFYGGTGKNWKDSTGWGVNLKTATSLQSIYGVGADSCDVLSINLPDNNLRGDIDLIGELTTLQTLNLSGNELIRELPVGLSSLKNLEVLDLSNNDFEGEVNAQIKDLDSLRYLSLSNNNFSGDLSHELWLLDSLTHLDLSDNDFSGEISSKIDSLIRLKYLGLSHNKMSGALPEGIWRRTDLEVLKLGENDFSGTISDDIANLDKLKVLTLNDNNFTGELSSEISKFDSLERFEIKNNSFENLPNLDSLENLKFVSCEGNKLTFEDLEPNVGLIYDPSVTFTYAPQQLFGREYDTVAVEGSLFKLPIPCGGAKNSYKWNKDGSSISGPARNYTLVFSEFMLSDTGSYYIEVQNDTVKDLTLQSFPVTIHIYNKPTLHSPADKSIYLPLVQELCWNDAGWADSYALQVATDANFSNLIVDESGITGTCFTIKSLNRGTTYYWRVNGKLGDAVSSWSEVWSFTTQPEVPDCPILYLPANDSTIAPVTLTLKWSPADDRTETYSVQVATDSAFVNLVVDEPGLVSTEYLLEGLERSTIYYWRVRGSNFSGSSGERSECNQIWKFQTIPPVIDVDPVNLVAIDGKHISVFTVRNIELFPDNALVMYNRWGKKVYDRVGYVNDFDMSDLPAGTYYYILNIRTEVELDKPAYKGFVEVIKN